MCLVSCCSWLATLGSAHHRQKNEYDSTGRLVRRTGGKNALCTGTVNVRLLENQQSQHDDEIKVKYIFYISFIMLRLLLRLLLLLVGSQYVVVVVGLLLVRPTSGFTTAGTRTTKLGSRLGAPPQRAVHQHQRNSKRSHLSALPATVGDEAIDDLSESSAADLSKNSDDSIDEEAVLDELLSPEIAFGIATRLGREGATAFTDLGMSQVVLANDETVDALDDDSITVVDEVVVPSDAIVLGNETTLIDEADAPSVTKILKFAIPAIGVWLCGPLLSLIDTSAVGLLSGTAQQAALNPAVAVTEYAALLIVRYNTIDVLAFV
jgi:hypothetical protein